MHSARFCFSRRPLGSYPRDPRDSIELWTRRLLVRNGDLLGMQGLHHVDSGSTSRREG
jgi:hypothetical protein